MSRIPWSGLLALLTGVGLGVLYSWVLSPRQVVDAEPIALRADFKDHYRSAIAAAFAATGDLARAQARLSLLGDADSVEALNAQAQRILADEANGTNNQPFESADQVAALASALEQDENSQPTTTSPSARAQTPVVEVTNNTVNPPTSTIPQLTSDIETPSTETFETTPTVETQSIPVVSTPRPTHTAVPTLGEPFALTGQETVCDPNLPDGLLQVIIFNSNRRQMPGMEILITWESGTENFFTGLKPELGNGYADYIMTPEITYTVQLRVGSDIASGLTSPTCQDSSSATYFGGIKLTFQQP
jgi:hypothetical protein